MHLQIASLGIRHDGSPLARWLAPSLLALTGTLGGCYYGDGGYVYGPPPPPPPRPFSLPTCPSAANPAPNVSIDTGGQLKTEAGTGAGVLVEYTTGGRWHVFTVCDTAISGYGCEFDITAQVIGGIVTNLFGEQLESDDIATSYCPNTAILGTTTSTDFDGIWFDTTPGATVRITAALGATIYNNLFYWMSGGVVRDDASANPVEFTPTTP
jgi:hypothetical protein